MHIKKELIRLIYGTSCESEFEGQPGSCQYRRYGTCGIIGKIDFCAATHLADHLIANGVTVQQWIPVTERLPDLIHCNGGGSYSEAVNILTSSRKVLTAVWDGFYWMCDAEYWDAGGEEITHWTPVLLPLPEPQKEDPK